MTTIKNPVWLKTTYLLEKDKPPLISGPYAEGMLDTWIRHSISTSGEGVLAWEKCNEEGEVYE